MTKPLRIKTAILGLIAVIVLCLATWIVVAVRVEAAQQEQVHFGLGLMAEVRRQLEGGSPPDKALQSALSAAPEWGEGHDYLGKVQDWGALCAILSDDKALFLEIRFRRPVHRTAKLRLGDRQ